MSCHSMFAAALPGARWSGLSIVVEEASNPRGENQACSSRTLRHRIFLLFVLVWALMVSQSGGGTAAADEPTQDTANSTELHATAVALPSSRVAHFSRRQPAPELQVATWVDQTGLASAPQLEGKVQLVVFWGINCPACVRKIPQVREVARRYRQTDLVIIGLHNSQIRPERVAKFVRDRDLNYPIAIDRNAMKRASWGMTSDAYHVRAIPHAAVVDRDGSLKYVGQFEKALHTAEALLKVTSS